MARRAIERPIDLADLFVGIGGQGGDVGQHSDSIGIGCEQGAHHVSRGIHKHVVDLQEALGLVGVPFHALELLGPLGIVDVLHETLHAKHTLLFGLLARLCCGCVTPNHVIVLCYMHALANPLFELFVASMCLSKAEDIGWLKTGTSTLLEMLGDGGKLLA